MLWTWPRPGLCMRQRRVRCDGFMLDAGFMGLEGCTYVGSGGTARLLWGCRLTPQTTQGGIGAAHGPQEKPREGIGVSRDLKTNPRRYRGRPRRKYVGV